MQPKPVPAPAQRRNTLTKPPHVTAPNAALYPTQMTLAGATPTYIAGAPTAPPIPATSSTGNMAGLNLQHKATNQKPYLAAEMVMMQESLKVCSRTPYWASPLTHIIYDIF